MTKRILVFGIGNPGRRDDGLGPAFLEKIEGRPTSFPNSGGGINVEAEFRYQLNVEDAHTMKDFDIVLFADAAAEGNDPAVLGPIAPATAIAFTTHAMAPASVLALCEELYGRAPEGYVLAIRGSDFDIGEGLSPEAERSLAAAVAVFEGFLEGVS